MWWVIIIAVSVMILVWSIKKNKVRLKVISAIMIPLSLIFWMGAYVKCTEADRASYSEKSESLSYQIIYTLSKGQELESDVGGNLHMQDYFYYTSRNVMKLEDYEIISGKVKADDVKLRMISDDILSPSIEVFIRYHEPILSSDEWFWITLFGSSDESLDNYIIDHYEISVTQDILDNDMKYSESELYN